MSLLATTGPLVWYTTRATGTVALLLLTAAVVLGILTTTRAGSATVPRFAVSDLHRRISLLAMAFVAVHVFTAVIDTYVSIGVPAAVVPFVSRYSPLWVGLGAVAFDLLIAVVATSLLRDHIPARAWRGVHWLVYLSYPIAVAHAVGVGTDLEFGWMQALTGLCLAAVVMAIGWRLWGRRSSPGTDTDRPTPLPTETATHPASLARRPVRPGPGR